MNWALECWSWVIQYFIDSLFTKKVKNWKILKNIENIEIFTKYWKKYFFQYFNIFVGSPTSLVINPLSKQQEACFLTKLKQIKEVLKGKKKEEKELSKEYLDYRRRTRRPIFASLGLGWPKSNQSSTTNKHMTHPNNINYKYNQSSMFICSIQCDLTRILASKFNFQRIYD